MRAAEILARFEAVSEERDGGFLARCVAHGDTTPSLRIWFGEDGKCRIVCRAGCDTADIVMEAGLRWRDMFDVQDIAVAVPENPPTPVAERHLMALRRYVNVAAARFQENSAAREYVQRRFGIDAETAARLRIGLDNGTDPYLTLPFRTVRYRSYPRVTVPLMGADGEPRGLQGRDISGECPDRWLSLTNPRGHRWAPYGLFKAASDSCTTIITEGPGDGLTAVSAGYNALLIRGAQLAGNRDVLNEVRGALAGQRLYVAGDGDASGARFAERVSESLGAPVIKMPHAKWDLSEWRSKRPNFPEELAGKMAKAELAKSRETKEAEHWASFARIWGEQHVR